MGVTAWSRYRYCVEYKDEDENLYLDEREPFRYVESKDNRFHTVSEGDSWWGLAHVYFAGIPRSCGVWWLLCEFQPQPIIDPTIRLNIGTIIIIPSLQMLRLHVFSEERKRFH